MGDAELRLLLKHPGLACAGADRTRRAGTLEYRQGEHVFGRLHAPCYPLAEGARCEVPLDAELRAVDSDRLDLCGYLDVVCSVLARSPRRRPFDADRFERFLAEYRSVRAGSGRCSLRLAADLSEVRVQLDDGHDTHSARVALDLCGGELYAVSQHSFPEPAQAPLFGGQRTLRQIVDRFADLAAQLRPFYRAMHQLDDVCWVLGAESRTSKSRSRRLVIGDGVSVQVTVDPWDAAARPDLKLFGPERLVAAPLRACARNLEAWDASAGLVPGLLRLLELPLLPARPGPAAARRLYEERECCVCFCLELDGRLPEVVCPNAACEQCFHADCLYRWLSALPAARRLLGAVHGRCPHCEQGISCAPLRT